MIRAVAFKYATRSLFRHMRRTFLSMVGVGVGCGITLLTVSWMAGQTDMQVRAVSESGGGHIRVVPKTWLDTRENSLRLSDWEGVLAELKKGANVKSAAPRARVNGLLAFGNRASGVSVVGVVPEVEQEANRVIFKSELDGRFLKTGDTGCVVIGDMLAKRLDVELDDDLFVTLAGKNDIQSAMLRIVGILDTGSDDLDAILCFTTLQDIQRVTGIPGAGEISILLKDYRHIGPAAQALQQTLGEDNTVITWKEVNPSVAAGVEGDRAFTRFLIGIIVLVVALGIAAAQLAAVLERRREFAILSALGMRTRQVVALVVLESVFIGLGGAVFALIFGGAAAYQLATKGVSLAVFMGEGFSFGDILLDPYIYGDFGPWLIWYAFAVSVIATVAASAYPAWLATRVDPAKSLRSV